MTRFSKGGRPRKTGYTGEPVSTLKSLGLTKRQSSEAQLLFRLAQEKPDVWEALRTGKISRKAAFATIREQRQNAGDVPGLCRAIRQVVNDYLQRHPGTPWADVDAALVSLLEAVREAQGKE